MSPSKVSTLQRPRVGTARRPAVATSRRSAVERQGEIEREFERLASRLQVVLAEQARAAQTTSKKRKSKKLVPQLDAALDCVVLAVDAAETSGWSLWRAGMLLDFGEVDVFSTQVADVFDAACALGGTCVLVVERPFQVRSGFSVGIGTGEKIWREYAKRHGFAKRILRVFPSTWRARTLPKGMASAKRAIVRPVEQAEARKVVEQHLGAFMVDALGEDSSPAVLLGKFASYSPAVAKLLPKKREKQVPLALSETSKKMRSKKKAKAA